MMKKKDKGLDKLPVAMTSMVGLTGVTAIMGLFSEVMGKMFGLGEEDKDKPSMTRVEIREMTAGIISAFIDEYQNKVINLESELEDRQYKIERMEKEREEQYNETKELKDQIRNLETALADTKKAKLKKSAKKRKK